MMREPPRSAVFPSTPLLRSHPLTVELDRLHRYLILPRGQRHQRMLTALPLNSSAGVAGFHRRPLPDATRPFELDSRIQLDCLRNARLVLNIVGEENLLSFIRELLRRHAVRAV